MGAYPSPLHGLSLRSYRAAEAAHAHDHHQVVLPLAGGLHLAVGDHEDIVGGDRAVVVAAGQIHRFRPAEGANRFVVLDLTLGDDRAERLVRTRSASAPFFPVDSGLGHLLGYLGERGTDRIEPALAHHATALLRDALERRFEIPKMPAVVADALVVMERRLAEPLTVADLAAETGLSPSRLHAAFRTATGQGPAACLADLRLDRAVDLLGQGRLGIAEIALACGYAEQSALTRALRRRRGVTPGQLRRR